MITADLLQLREPSSGVTIFNIIGQPRVLLHFQQAWHTDPQLRQRCRFCRLPPGGYITGTRIPDKNNGLKSVFHGRECCPRFALWWLEGPLGPQRSYGTAAPAS